MRTYNLVCADLSCNIKYTYRRDDYTSFSWPDHILTLHLIKHITCTNDVANFSDHLPLYFCQALDQHYLLSTLKPQVDVRWTLFSIKFGLNAVTSGVLFQIKKKTKKRYKYEVRRLRWQRERIIRERLGIALSQSSHRDFWKEVRNITLSSKGRGSSAPIVDGCSSDTDISPAFSAKLCDLLNSNTSLENPLSCDELPLTSVSADTISEALLRRMLLAAFGITTLLVLTMLCFLLLLPLLFSIWLTPVHVLLLLTVWYSMPQNTAY